MLEGLLIFLILLVFFVVLLAYLGFQIIPQAQCKVVERLGQYHKTLTPGVNIIWPFIDKTRKVDWSKTEEDAQGRPFTVHIRTDIIDLRESVFDFPGQNVITRDNVVIKINALLFYQVTDPIKALYEIKNLPVAIEQLTQTSLRNLVGELDLDGTLTSRETINSRLTAILDDATDKWGVKVNRVELKDIVPPPDIQAAMEKQMRAERERRATILEAEGSKRSRILEAEGIREAEILEAEGHKQAQILKAEGESSAINQVTEAIKKSGADPSKYLIAVRYIEAYENMVTADTGNKVIYLPYEATSLLSSIGGISEMLK